MKNTSEKLQKAIQFASTLSVRLYKEDRRKNARTIDAYETMANQAARHQFSARGEEDYLHYLESCVDPEEFEPTHSYRIAAENVLRAIGE